jgi:hypothetical protein
MSARTIVTIVAAHYATITMTSECGGGDNKGLQTANPRVKIRLCVDRIDGMNVYTQLRLMAATYLIVGQLGIGMSRLRIDLGNVRNQ